MSDRPDPEEYIVAFACLALLCWVGFLVYASLRALAWLS